MFRVCDFHQGAKRSQVQRFEEIQKEPAGSFYDGCSPMVKTLGCGPRNEGSTPSFRPLYLLNPWRGRLENSKSS